MWNFYVHFHHFTFCTIRQSKWISLIARPSLFSLCLVEPLSSVSSLEVHFDLLDLTELTDMSDQELAEVFADSDEETHNESPAGKAC